MVAVSSRLIHPQNVLVSGSTSRNTHLPGIVDFDIGLWPAESYPTPIVVDQLRHTDDEYRKALVQFINDLAARVADNVELRNRMAALFGKSPTDLCRALDQPASLKTGAHPHWQITAKIKLDQINIIEVAVAHHAGHYIGLLYNKYWQQQIGGLEPDLAEAVTAQVCLLKRILTSVGLYKKVAGVTNVITFTSRRLEQFIIQEAMQGSQTPLLHAMRRVTEADDDTDLWELFPGAPEDILKKLHISRDDLRPMRAQSELENAPTIWRKFKLIAGNVADRAYDYAHLLVSRIDA